MSLVARAKEAAWAGVAIGTAAMLLPPSTLIARDLGTLGQTWSIAEPDLLATIRGRLAGMSANGGIERMQRDLATRAEVRVRRPTPVAGLSPTSEGRRWRHDPSVVVEADIRDQKGRLVAAQGTRVNPLAFVTLRQDLVFLDGDDMAQVAWATARWSPRSAKIILVSGSPFDLMKDLRRRFYFDQRGSLVEKFGIAHVPAVVRAAGERLEVEEIVLPGARRS